MPENSNQPLGNNIRKYRIIRGCKQKDFAKNLGVARSTLSKIENGKSVKIPLLQKIATCLKVKVQQLFSDPPVIYCPPENDSQ